MKARHFVLIFGAVALAAAGGWFAARHWPAHHSASSGAGGSERKILFYQSAMHPWIKSDKPGRCTICGMELTPVFEGEKGIEAGEGIITLGSNAIQVINVQTDEVKRRPLQRTLRVAGMIEDNDARHRIVSAYVDGRIDKLAVNFVGAEVVAGQPLATFYSPPLLTAEREYVALLKPGQPAGLAGRVAEQERMLAAAAQRLTRLGLADAQIVALSQKPEAELHTEILAPGNGTVVARFVYEGQYVKEGEKLFELADFATMWFQFDAYERDLVWLKPGQKVDVTTPAVPGKVFTGAIAFVDPNLKEMTRSAKVRVELENPLVEANGQKRRELFHRLYADGAVKLEIPEVLAVPRSAVLSPGGQPVVYVDKGGGSFEQRPLKLGRLGDELWEVLGGLNEGERVVTTGNMLIDAQAQLNASAGQGAVGHQHGAPAGSDSTNTTPALPPLTEAQQAGVKEFLALAGAITTALAADDLKEFTTHADKTHTAVPALAAPFPPDSPWRSLVAGIQTAGHVASAGDLKTARKNFHPLSQAVVEFTKALRQRESEFKSLKIFRCPMTKDAFPGAPRTAEWIQFATPIRNPYFGAEMLDCGSEVKP